MKRLLTLFMALVLMVALSGSASAAGSVTQTLDQYPNANMRVLTYSWTGDASNGTVPSTATSTAITNDIAGWYVYAIETNPGTTAPTTLYDIVINDAESLDISGGMLANRSATVTEKITPRLDSTYSIFGGVLVHSVLTLVITNQTDVSATGTVKLILAK
ncbi:MAG: hypothetical protein ABIJ57_00375 [Pseudomonadota bacterium]